MQLNSLKSNLTLINYPENTWIRPDSLNCLILENETNVYFNPRLEKIKFDTTNELIMVKYSQLTRCSSGLNQFSYNTTTNAINIITPNGTVFENKIFKEPKSGDYIYAYDPVEKTYTGSMIKSVVYHEKYTTLIFNDSLLITKIDLTRRGMKFFFLKGGVNIDETIYINNPAELFTEKDLTSYEADIFIGLDRVAGIEFTKSWR